jgi:hypothetical protein
MSDDCDAIACLDGASCLIECGGMGACDFAECTGGAGPQSCDRNVIVCNRDCPAMM